MKIGINDVNNTPPTNNGGVCISLRPKAKKIKSSLGAQYFFYLEEGVNTTSTSFVNLAS